MFPFSLDSFGANSWTISRFFYCAAIISADAPLLFCVPASASISISMISQWLKLMAVMTVRLACSELIYSIIGRCFSLRCSLHKLCMHPEHCSCTLHASLIYKKWMVEQKPDILHLDCDRGRHQSSSREFCRYCEPKIKGLATLSVVGTSGDTKKIGSISRSW